MLMQAEATFEGVNLTWFQDDFDTLAGFNIYRSTELHGYYTRINQYILGIDETEFLDTTVEPGQMYYYNFTVVQTDLTESEPSGKVVVRSYDKMAPNIYHTPIYKTFTGSNLVINATITDNIAVNFAKVYYKVNGETNYKVLVMDKHNDRYTAIIPSQDIKLDGFVYYIEAFDGINYTYRATQNNPVEVMVQLAVNKNSIGDVNADGSITILDALMVLQAINGRINLNEEQFLKADLDANGVLETFEVLKIMQYANGMISSSA